jgi:hypothetical protein
MINFYKSKKEIESSSLGCDGNGKFEGKGDLKFMNIGLP